MPKILVVYDSRTGNTENMALTVQKLILETFNRVTKLLVIDSFKNFSVKELL